MKNINRIMFLSLIAGMSLTGCNNGGNSQGGGEKKYTYNTCVSGSPNTWNPHEWETNDDSIILGFTTCGLYEFVFNEDRDGYKIVPEMAAEYPVDVTSTLTTAERNLYGITDKATKGLKWSIDLREDAVWEDGTPINADTYLYSMEQILSPDMMNYRATSYYNGSVAIARAKEFYDGGHDKYEFATSSTPSDDGGKKYFSFFEPMEISTRLGDTYANYSMYDFYNDSTYKKEFQENYNSTHEPCSGYKKVLSKEWGTVSNPQFIDISIGNNRNLVISYVKEFCKVINNITYSDADLDYYLFKHTGKHERMEFDGEDKAVGITKTGDYQITIYTVAECNAFDFEYSMCSNWIVKEDLYEANKKQVGTLTKSTYGTSLDTYASYGPYRLSSYQTDKLIHLTRNDKYFGYTPDEYHNEDEYQCTDIDIQIISQQSTQLNMFLNGQLDDVSLTADDMRLYGKSSYLHYEPNTYTSKVTFNTDFDKLVTRQNEAGKNINKTIITNQKFREAFFWCLDRATFCQNNTSGSKSAVVPINDLYTANNTTGIAYRNTTQGKKVVSDLVGTNTNGYDIEKAADLFQAAYDEEIASLKEGHIKASDEVLLEFKVYNDEKIYDKMINFFQDSFDAATEGTDLEGKILIKKTVDPNYYESMQAGQSDMIYTTWGGAQLNPYGMLECYCDSTRMFEYGFNPDEEQLTLKINGQDVTMTYYNWSLALDGAGGDYSAAKATQETRLDVLSGVELALCKQYRFVSVYARCDAFLLAPKFNYGTEDYVSVMGYGGIRYYSFNYNDAEWASYIATHKINYKD